MSPNARQAVSESATVLPHPACVTAADVAAELRCSRAAAYEHMRRAVGRLPGARGMLRVPRATWDRYVAEVMRCGSTSAGGSGGRGALRP